MSELPLYNTERETPRLQVRLRVLTKLLEDAQTNIAANGGTLNLLGDLDIELPALRAAIVARERSRGRSWADVGGAMGISRQAAQQRFGAVVEVGDAGAAVEAARIGRAGIPDVATGTVDTPSAVTQRPPGVHRGHDTGVER